MDNTSPNPRGAVYAVVLVISMLAALVVTEMVVRGIVAGGVCSPQFTDPETPQCGFAKNRRPGQTCLAASQEVVRKSVVDRRVRAVAGDSHISDTDVMQEVVFLGRGGMSMPEIADLLRAYFRHHTAPGAAVAIEVGPQMFAPNRTRDAGSFVAGSFVRQVLPLRTALLEPELLNYAQAKFAEVPSRLLTAVIQDAGATAAEEQRAVSWFRHFTDGTDAYGRPPSWGKAPTDVASALVQRRLRNQLPMAAMNEGAPWRALVDISTWLRQRDVDICFVRTPVAPDYQEALDRVAGEPRFQRYRQLLLGLAKRLEVPYVDYLDLAPSGLPRDLFRDQDHMDCYGRSLFWPALWRACFDEGTHSMLLGADQGLLSVPDMVNPSFDLTAAAGRSPPGWLYEGKFERPRLAASDQASPLALRYSSNSFGVNLSAGLGSAGWWSLGKRFELDGASRVAMSVLVSPRRGSKGAAADAAAGERWFADDDAYFRLVLRDARGRPIDLADSVQFSPTVSIQSGGTQAGGWYRLQHALEVPAHARELELWIVATDGDNTIRAPGWRGSNGDVLLDEFLLHADGPLYDVTSAE